MLNHLPSRSSLGFGALIQGNEGPCDKEPDLSERSGDKHLTASFIWINEGHLPHAFYLSISWVPNKKKKQKNVYPPKIEKDKNLGKPSGQSVLLQLRTR